MSIYGACFENVVLPIVDRLRGQSTMETYRFLMQSQHWDAERRSELVDAKVRRLVAHAYAQVPHYRRVMDEAGLRPEGIRTARDLEALPILEREDLRRAPREMLAADAERRGVWRQRTSGTKGTQIDVARCAHGRMWVWACMYRYYRWMGVRSGDRRLDVWSIRDFVPAVGVKRRLWRRVWRHHRLLAYQTTDADVDAQVRFAERYRPTWMRAYASAMYRFAERAAALGVRLPTLRAISTSADALMPSMRRTIIDALGTPVFDQYGCGEAGSIAFECEAHQGMHIAEEHVLVDVDAEPGTEGDIIVTDLDNYAMPFIRYRNGDRGILEVGACPCGRSTQRLRSPIGRTGEYIELPDSRRYNRTFFQLLINEYPSIRTFQVAQTGTASIEIRVEEEGGADGGAAIERRLRDHFGPAIQVRVRPATVGVGPTGKLQVLVPLQPAGQ